MISYKLFKDNNLKYKKIEKINNSYYIETDNSKYIVKEKKKDLDKKFNYLLSRGFNYFPDHFTLDKYDIFSYINDSNISNEERLCELINITAIMHFKTTRYKLVSVDTYKEIYEKLLKQVEDLDKYYSELNNFIDTEIYMSPSNYFLVLNISIIYSALSYCRKELENWYELVKNKSKERVCFVHNNLDLEHLLYNGKPYLISFNKSKIDSPVCDLLSIYDKYYKNIDYNILKSYYLKKYPLTEDELKLFFINISIPRKVSFDNDEYKEIKEIKQMLDRLYKSNNLINNYYTNKEHN